jgi:hypothetical protein
MLKTKAKKEEKMKNKPVMGIVLTILLLSIIAFSGCVEKTSKLEIVDFELKDPNPLFYPRYKPVSIYQGESITLSVTVQNKGDEMIYGNTYRVGITVKSPGNGGEYWELPSEQLITRNLALKGKSSHTFTVSSKEEETVTTGNFKFQAHIKSEEKDDVIATSKKMVTIEVIPPTKTFLIGFEAVFAIIGLLVIAYLLRKKK